MAEYENPTRRYKWFRPRQAARGTAQIGAGNYPTAQLFNDSTGPHLLIVRDLRVTNETIATSMQMYYSQIQLFGGSPVVTPLVPGEAATIGKFAAVNQAALAVFDFMFASSTQSGSWIHDFPLAVLPPGWGLNVQSGSTNTLMVFSALFEVIAIDELDYLY